MLVSTGLLPYLHPRFKIAEFLYNKILKEVTGIALALTYRSKALASLTR
jgi:hypothetical protein